VYYLSTKEFDLFEKLYSPHPSGGGGRDEEAELEELLEDNEEVALPYLIEHELQCDSWIREALLVRVDLITMHACFELSGCLVLFVIVFNGGNNNLCVC
jgi:hypothetical protein